MGQNVSVQNGLGRLTAHSAAKIDVRGIEPRGERESGWGALRAKRKKK